MNVDWLNAARGDRARRPPDPLKSFVSQAQSVFDPQRFERILTSSVSP